MIQDQPSCVLFSGGADSTLAAWMVAQDGGAGPVHLLSFKHRYMSDLEKTERNIVRLRARIGTEAVEHRWIDMDPLWRAIQSSRHSAFGEWGAFSVVVRGCLACKVAMHHTTAAFCLRHNIRRVADGSHPSGARLFPEQSCLGIDAIRRFYARHGIAYETPVYEIPRTDFKLHDDGITEKRDTKSEHLYYTNQFACNMGLLAYFYFYLLRPLDRRGRRLDERAAAYLERCLGDPVLARLASSLTG